MALIDRVRNICVTPGTEWSVIAGESTPAAELFTGYVAPLAAVGAVAGFIGGSIVGRTMPLIGTYRVGIVPGLVAAILAIVMAVVGVAILAFIINALAPSFGGQKDSQQALKAAVYSYTPAWVAGILNILPLLGVLAIVGALYGIYLLYLGLPRLMKCPEDKAVGYTAVVVICAIVLAIVIGAVTATLAGIGMMTSGALSGAASGPSTSADEVKVDRNSPLGKLQALGEKLDESNKKMEAAEKAGDSGAAAAAAMDAVGKILGGGSRVDPISTDELKPLVPDTFAGLPRTRTNVEKNGIAGLSVSKAEATYGEGARQIDLTISDTGGVSGLVALAAWTGQEEDKEDGAGFERTHKVDGRLVHEKMSKNGGSNEYAVVLGDRFIVGAESRSVDFTTLKSAVGSLNLAKLESMKDQGVQK